MVSSLSMVTTRWGSPGGDLLVGGVDAAVEVIRLALEAVLVCAVGLDAARVAAAGAVGVWIR